MFKHSLDVVPSSDGVTNKYIVKFFIKLQLTGFGCKELQMGETSFGCCDCFFVIVNSDTVVGFHCRKEVAAFAAHVQNTTSRPNDKSVNPLKPVIVVLVMSSPLKQIILILLGRCPVLMTD